MDGFMRDSRGSAVRWFAFAAALLTVASLAGAHALDWLSQSGRVALVAYAPPGSAPPRRAAANTPDVDTTPTGSIPSNALVIRIR